MDRRRFIQGLTGFTAALMQPFKKDPYIIGCDPDKMITSGNYTIGIDYPSFAAFEADIGPKLTGDLTVTLLPGEDGTDTSS